MRTTTRWNLTAVLIGLAAFCVFGFLATYEPPGFLAFRWFYGTILLACAAGIAATWLARPGR
ncbi:MAG: hypothetical protein U0835_16400 [Isosphaeraceae bacterium]